MIAVVGAGGFIGRAVCARLPAHEIVAIGRANAEHVETVDVVIHLALFSEADARAALARWRGRAGRMVAISSGDVYRVYGQLKGSEPWAGGPAAVLDEDAPLRTQFFPYGGDYEKILVERAVHPPAVVLRLPKVYGPGDRQRHLAREIGALSRGELTLDAGFAAWRWTHGFVDDVAAAIVLAATHPRAEGRLYNVGESHTPTMAERLSAFARHAGGSVRVTPGGAPRPDLVMDTRRIRDELGYSEPTPPEQALARTVEALRGG